MFSDLMESNQKSITDNQNISIHVGIKQLSSKTLWIKKEAFPSGGKKKQNTHRQSISVRHLFNIKGHRSPIPCKNYCKQRKRGLNKKLFGIMKRIEFHIHQLVNASHLLLKGAEQVFRKLTLAILTVYYVHFFLHNFFLTVLYGRCDTFELLPDAHLSLRAFLPSWCFSFLHRTQLRPVCKLKFFMAHCTKSGSWRMNKAHSIKPYRTE